MNLGKLLAAGKSIMNGRTDINYRACKQGYLPKFGSPKNPFKTEPTQPSPEPAKETVVATSRATRAAEPAIAVATSIASVAVIAKEIPPLPAMREKKKTNWLSPAAIFHRSPVKSEASPAALSGKMPSATQEELSLDSVKVVHNDLSDVDVEVVPIKSRPAPAEPQPAKKSWEALGEQLFGVKAT